jgi:uncharacterized protein (DUF427 family)
MLSRIEPGPGQESVWDYPRPPRLERVPQRIRVVFNGVTIADSTQTYRVLETSHPPTYYIPPADLQLAHFVRTARSSLCEWKGNAAYYSVRVGERVAENAAWFYPRPSADFAPIKDYVALYASMMDECYVGDERVQAQPGDFYGGWITSAIVGPFKGDPGTWGW